MPPKKKTIAKDDFSDSESSSIESYNLTPIEHEFELRDNFDDNVKKLLQIIDLYNKQLEVEKPNESIIEAFVKKITELIQKL